MFNQSRQHSLFDENVKKEFIENPYLQNYFNKSLSKPPEIPDEIVNKKHDEIAFNFQDTDLNEIPIPSNLRVSTMTAICSINMNIDLKLLFELVEVIEIDDKNTEIDSNIYPYIRSCQFGNDNIKGISDKKIRKKRVNQKKTKRTYFQNQATLIIAINRDRKVNLKIFRNGKIQMTGLKCKEEGMIACEKLLEEINKIKKINKDIIISDQQSDQINNNVISNFSIVLINSDFFGGFKVKREKLYAILSRNDYFVSYEPDIYPGVNSKFYWNKMTINTPDTGKCRCSSPCDGKGTGDGNGNCKKITIATFQSGNIIITGARNNEQTMEAYNFINRIFRENYSEIVRQPTNDSIENVEKDKSDFYISNPKKIKIKTCDIMNFELRNTLLNTMENI